MVLDSRPRHVKGQDLLALVRSLKSWRKQSGRSLPKLHPDDQPYFEYLRVMSGGWYPLESFLRLLKITHEVTTRGGYLGMLDIGRGVLGGYRTLQSSLVKMGRPRDTLEAFRIGWSRHFDFTTVEVSTSSGKAWIKIINYDDINELHCTLHIGFFDALIELTGGTNVKTVLKTKPWIHAEPALFECTWDAPIQG